MPEYESIYRCKFCLKAAPQWHNYCSWECQVAEATKNGGKRICPNGLPVRCIRADNTMMEHEHADHPDYRFPVTIEFCGNVKGLGDIGEDLALYGRVLTDAEWRKSKEEEHALVYTDGCIAVTLHEHTYAMWSLRDGQITAGHMWKKGDWRLSEASVKKILEATKP